MFTLQGRRILVTGAGSGIGASIARRFALAQARLVLIDRDVAGLAALAAACGSQAVMHVVDLSDAAGCRSAAAACDAVGGCDVLIANAGIGHVGTILQTTEAELDRLWTVNVKSVFHLVQALLPGMLAQQRGSVIVTASIGGVVGIRDRLAYCTTKSALVGMVKCLALDHAASGVRFNAICPGRVETPLVSQRLAESADPVASRAAMTATQALGGRVRQTRSPPRPNIWPMMIPPSSPAVSSSSTAVGRQENKHAHRSLPRSSWGRRLWPVGDRWVGAGGGG